MSLYPGLTPRALSLRPFGACRTEVRRYIPHPASRIPYPVSRILHLASWILNHASCILHPASRIPHPGSCILDPGSALCYFAFRFLLLRISELRLIASWFTPSFRLSSSLGYPVCSFCPCSTPPRCSICLLPLTPFTSCMWPITTTEC